MSHDLPTFEDEVAFVLFDQLRVHESAQRKAYSGAGRDDLEMILREARRFAKGEVWPTNARGDREGCTFDAGEVKTPTGFTKLYEKIVAGGWLGLTADEKYGGAQLPVAFGAAVGEIMSRANIAFSPYTGLTRGVARLVDSFGEPWMRTHVVPQLFSGAWAGTMCMTEPAAGTAIGDIKTTAKQVDGQWQLKGNKIFITGGEQDLTENIVHMVLARTEGAPAGIKGVSLFLVSKHRIDPGTGALSSRNDVQCTGIEHKMGLSGSATCQLAFGDDDACVAHLVGEECAGIQYMFQLMNEARIGTGMHGLAAAGLAYGIARDYAYDRVQGTALENLKDTSAERVAIARHPDVKRMLFTMKARTEGMRALLLFAASLADDAHSLEDEAARVDAHALLEMLTPLCKSHCSDVGYDVATLALQTLGGAGYTADWPVEQTIRDVKVASIYEGANGIQALDLIGRKLGHRGGATFVQLCERIEADIERAPEDCQKTLKDALEDVRNTTGLMAGWGFSGEQSSAALYASQYLTALSHLVTAWLLVVQGDLARDALVDARGARARFYEQKIATARFYVKTLLLENKSLLAIVREGDREILNLEVD